MEIVGIALTYTYDNTSRLKRLKRLKHENTSTTLYDDQFTYNTANQISQIAGLAATKNYTYDNINRLTAVTVGGSTVESYTYDAVGNRTASHLSSSYTTGAFNRVTATDSATYTYNANGSTTGKTVGAVNWTYGWDRENRMVSAGDGTNSASYQYDALGRRVKRAQGSSVEKYTNDGQDVVLDDINSALTKYQNGTGIDNKFKSVSGGASKYFLGDHLGSTAILANPTGSSVDSNSYDSFGNAVNGSFASRYQFTGRELDAITGVQFSRARFYDPNLARFLSEDPIGFRGGDFNLYGYVRNGPTDKRDPSGKDIWGVAISGSGGLGIRDGVAGSLATLYGVSGSGIFSDGPFDFGTASSYGAFSSCGCAKNDGEVWAFGGGVTYSLAASNARKFADLGGPFESYFLGIGIVSIEFDYDPVGGVWVAQLGFSPPITSVGKFGFARYCTTTPPETIGTIRDLGQGLANGINKTYGSPYR